MFVVSIRKKTFKMWKIYHEKYLLINYLHEVKKIRIANHYWELDTVEGKKSDLDQCFYSSKRVAIQSFF